MSHDYQPSLRSRISREVNSTPVNPFATPPKEEHASEPLPDIRDAIEDRKKVLALTRLINLSAELAIEEKRAREARKPLTIAVKNLLERATKFMCGGNRVTYFNAPRKELSARKLKELGVPEAKIKAAYVTRDCWTLKITPPGLKDEEEDE